MYIYVFYFNLTSLGYHRGTASKALHVSFILIIILQKKNLKKFNSNWEDEFLLWCVTLKPCTNKKKKKKSKDT